jgi:hypothetical protein
MVPRPSGRGFSLPYPRHNLPSAKLDLSRTMNAKPLTERIETALHAARDFESFAHGLLRNCLNWPIERNIAKPDELGYPWSADELNAPETELKLLAREILLAPRSEQPYGIFLLEFREQQVLETRGLATPLRKVLRGLVAGRRKDPSLHSWAFDRILFICTYDYKQFVFAQFWDPFGTRKVNEARLASFG